MIRVLSIAVILGLSACGFQPMYGTTGKSNAKAQAHLSQIEIGNIQDREGQYLRNALIDRFYLDQRPHSPVYALQFSNLEEQLIDLDITKFDDSTRGQLRISVTMTLQDKQSGQALLSRNLRSVTSYNILASEFSTRVSEDNARLNTLDDLAQQIETQLSLYFQR